MKETGMHKRIIRELSHFKKKEKSKIQTRIVNENN